MASSGTSARKRLNNKGYDESSEAVGKVVYLQRQSWLLPKIRQNHVRACQKSFRPWKERTSVQVDFLQINITIIMIMIIIGLSNQSRTLSRFTDFENHD